MHTDKELVSNYVYELLHQRLPALDLLRPEQMQEMAASLAEAEGRGYEMSDQKAERLMRRVATELDKLAGKFEEYLNRRGWDTSSPTVLRRLLREDG